ncbi:hypothetical protein ACFPRL_11025 [Pseudoclavibacter helvolus]
MRAILAGCRCTRLRARAWPRACVSERRSCARLRSTRSRLCCRSPAPRAVTSTARCVGPARSASPASLWCESAGCGSAPPMAAASRSSPPLTTTVRPRRSSPRSRNGGERIRPARSPCSCARRSVPWQHRPQSAHSRMGRLAVPGSRSLPRPPRSRFVHAATRTSHCSGGSPCLACRV